MKKLLLILLCLPIIGFGQVYIPDSNFKAYLIAHTSINTNGDSEIQLSEANSYAGWLLINGLNIANLTGIEEFINIYRLDCSDNQLTNLDVSNNTALTELNCAYNQLTNLDVSNNTALISLLCYDNQLTTLDIRNGNNQTMRCADDGPFGICAFNNPLLECILVDNSIWCTANWDMSGMDPQHYFSNNCSGTDIQEHTTNKEHLKVTDLLGRETKGAKNEILFYIYDDGTVEKRIIIEQ